MTVYSRQCHLGVPNVNCAILMNIDCTTVMVYVHVCMCERDTVGRGYQYVGHTMQATETGLKGKASIEARAVRLPTLKNRVV